MPYFFYHLLRWCPGIVGIFLRQKLYRRLLRGCGRNVLIGRSVDLKNPRAIVLGDNVILNDYACLDASKYSGSEVAIALGDGVFIGASTTLTAGPGKILLEESCNIGSGCTIFAIQDTILEHHALLAGFCTVGFITKELEQDWRTPPATAAASSLTLIGTGCWLGLRSQIAAGIEIGEGTIVGAHSIVTESLPDYAIAFGRPAEVKRMRP